MYVCMPVCIHTHNVISMQDWKDLGACSPGNALRLLLRLLWNRRLHVFSMTPGQFSCCSLLAVANQGILECLKWQLICACPFTSAVLPLYTCACFTFTHRSSMNKSSASNNQLVWTVLILNGNEASEPPTNSRILKMYSQTYKMLKRGVCSNPP